MSRAKNRRVRLTKRLLRESLIEILETKNIQQVSVTELCKAAGINRSTFYAHYSIPADILTDIKKDFAEQLVASIRQSTADQTPKLLLARICEYIYENRELEKTILTNSTDDEVLEAALASSFQIWGTTIPFIQIQHMDSESRRLIMAFYYHGILRVIREWIRYDIDKTPKEVADILYATLFHEAC